MLIQVQQIIYMKLSFCMIHDLNQYKSITNVRSVSVRIHEHILIATCSMFV